MHLSLVGMSLIGKSHWSSKLAETGFRRYCCDDLIEQRLARELEDSSGRALSMGEWMGFPYESRYRPREARYLELESQVLADVLLELEAHDRKENVVIDTTGSVIYLQDTLLQKLRERTMVVHLTTPGTVQEEMCKKYVANPTPMVWKDHFMESPEKTGQESLIACYPRFLAARESKYQDLSHLALDYFMLRQPGLEVGDFLDAIGERSATGRKSNR